MLVSPAPTLQHCECAAEPCVQSEPYSTFSPAFKEVPNCCDHYAHVGNPVRTDSCTEELCQELKARQSPVASLSMHNDSTRGRVVEPLKRELGSLYGGLLSYRPLGPQKPRHP